MQVSIAEKDFKEMQGIQDEDRVKTSI